MAVGVDARRAGATRQGREDRLPWTEEMASRLPKERTQEIGGHPAPCAVVTPTLAVEVTPRAR